MTTTAHLRAALEKHNIFYDDWSAMTKVAILEAMAQHRAEALEEVEAWCESREPLVYWQGHVQWECLQSFKAHLSALKTHQHGNI